MSDKRKEQARINGLKGGRKVRWEWPIAEDDPRRRTHRYLVRKGELERLCKSKPACPHIDLWCGPRPLCADMGAHYDAWHKRTAPDVSVYGAFKAGWVARGKCGNDQNPATADNETPMKNETETLLPVGSDALVVPLRKPSEWGKETGVIVLDYGGWEGKGEQYEIPITREDFLGRCCSSRCQIPHEIMREMMGHAQIDRHNDKTLLP